MKLYAQRLARHRHERAGKPIVKVSIAKPPGPPRTGRARATSNEPRASSVRAKSNESRASSARGCKPAPPRLSSPKSGHDRRPRADTEQPSAAITRVKRAISAAKLVANQRNALRSTGPRSPEGKQRAAMNALKHGLCAAPSLSPVLPGECAGTYETITEELREEFHPRTAMETWIIQQVAQQLWRLMRAAEVERRLIAVEERRAARAIADGTDERADGGTLPPPGELMARAMSAAGTSHPMMLLARYERGMQSMVLRMLARLAALQKRPNEALYSRDDVEAFRAERARWNAPAAPPPPPPPPSSSQQPAPAPRVSDPIPLTIKTKPIEPTACGEKPAIPNGPAGFDPKTTERAERNEPTAAPDSPSPIPMRTPQSGGWKGRGEGSSTSARISQLRKNPHPIPLPSERERGPASAPPHPSVQPLDSVVQSDRSTEVAIPSASNSAAVPEPKPRDPSG